MIIYPPPAQPAAGALLAANNLSDIASAASARTSLGVESALDTREGRNTRRTRDTILMAGGTTGTNGPYLQLNEHANVAGLPITILHRLRFPSSKPSGNPNNLSALSSATSNNFVANAQRVLLNNTTGFLQIEALGADTTVNARRFISATDYQALYAGRTVGLGVAFSAGDSPTNPTVVLEAQDISADFSNTYGSGGSGVAPNWCASSLVATYLSWGRLWTGDTSHRSDPPILIIGTLTVAEMQRWCLTGELPDHCRIVTGSAVNRYTTASALLPSASDANSTSGLDSPSATYTLAAQADPATGSAGAYSVKATKSGTGGGYIRIPAVGVAGGRYRFRLMVRSDATMAEVSAGLKNNTSDVAYTVIAGAQTTVGAASGWVLLDVVFFAHGDFTHLTLSRAAGGTSSGAYLECDDFYFRVQGPVARHVIQPIPVLLDLGDNCMPGVLPTGCTPVTERREWEVQAETSTNGNQQLLGASAFTDYTKHVLDPYAVIDNKGAATRTVSLGSASGGAQYASGVSVPPGKKVQTLLTQLLASNNLWVNSDGTDRLRVSIRGRKLD